MAEEVFCLPGSPLVPFKACYAEIETEIKSSASNDEIEVFKETAKAIKTHAWRLIVGKHASANGDKQFMDIILKQEKELPQDEQGKVPPARFIKLSREHFDISPISNEVLAALVGVLSPGCQNVLNSKHCQRFLVTPLPEPNDLVSKTLGVPLERVMAGTKKSDVLDYGRLIRSFGNSFLADKLPKHSCVLLAVTSSLFGYMCSQKGREPIPWYNVWVEDKSWDGKTPYGKVYQEGTRYYVQVMLSDLLTRFSDACTESTQRGGPMDDLI